MREIKEIILHCSATKERSNCFDVHTFLGYPKE